MRRHSGQATLEYILMLFFVVSLFILIFRGTLAPALSQLQKKVLDSIDQSFTGDRLHRLNFSH